MKKIAVMEDFLTPERRKRVLAAAEKHGFAVDFYGRGKAPAEGLDQYEIIYGWCEPGDLKRATALKWYCCGFAGVDLLSDDGLYANPDVMLSNSSGAYGLTISASWSMALPRPTFTTMASRGSSAMRSRLRMPAVSATAGRAITRISVSGSTSSSCCWGSIRS